MTVIVGIQCSDGVVFASDSAATYAAGGMPTLGQQRVTKVWHVENQALYATTGSIGMTQLLLPAMRGLFTRKDLVATKVVSLDRCMARISTEIGNTLKPHFENARNAVGVVGLAELQGPLICKSLLGMFFEKQPVVFQFSEIGTPEHTTEDLPFVALGSGQPTADPFLAFLRRVICPGRLPTAAEGRLMATWTVNHVIVTSYGGVGGPVQIATLAMTAKGPEVEVVADATQEHMQAVFAAEAALQRHVTGEGTPAVPVPKPAP